jgi:hypothetical protein
MLATNSAIHGTFENCLNFVALFRFSPHIPYPNSLINTHGKARQHVTNVANGHTLSSQSWTFL